MNAFAQFTDARKAFHATLLESTLTINSAGVPSNADKDSKSSVLIAKGIADLLKAETIGERIAGQTSGNQFGVFVISCVWPHESEVCTPFPKS